MRDPSGWTEATEPNVRIVLVEPLPVIRAGVGRAIEADPRLEVFAEVGGADDALTALENARSSDAVTLVSMRLGGERDAFWLIRTLRERYPRNVVLALGANADADLVSRALFIGADGFLDETVELPEFLDALRRSVDREMVIAGPAAGAIGEIAEGIERQSSGNVRLTDREREVLAVAAEGLTAREIAARLGVSERTVTTHLGRIYGKLGVGSRLAAIRAASQAGLVSIPPGD